MTLSHWALSPHQSIPLGPIYQALHQHRATHGTGDSETLAATQGERVAGMRRGVWIADYAAVVAGM